MERERRRSGREERRARGGMEVGLGLMCSVALVAFMVFLVWRVLALRLQQMRCSKRHAYVVVLVDLSLYPCPRGQGSGSDGGGRGNGAGQAEAAG